MDIKYDDLIGKPFKLGTSGPHEYDCVGLMCEMARRIGVAYDPNFNHTAFKYECRSNEILNYFGNKKEIDKPIPGSIILFKHPSGLVTHMGMMVDARRFIHTTRNTNVVIEKLSSQEWQWKIHSIYNLK